MDPKNVTAKDIFYAKQVVVHPLFYKTKGLINNTHVNRVDHFVHLPNDNSHCFTFQWDVAIIGLKKKVLIGFERHPICLPGGTWKKISKDSCKCCTHGRNVHCTQQRTAQDISWNCCGNNIPQ